MITSTLKQETFRFLNMNTLGERLREVMQELKIESPKELARFCGVSEGLVSQWFSGQTKLGPKPLLAFSKTHFSIEWISTGRLPKYVTDEGQRPLSPQGLDELRGGSRIEDRTNHPRRRTADFELVSADQTDGEVGEIEYWDAKGSCGGGFLNYEQLPKGHLIKEATFFHKYGVKPANLFAIYADGNSMADFIVDGDIVIFDKTKTTPVSGKIFLIDHPEGLRIKQLRRGIDGAWVLESKNPDKRTFPDERIEPGQEELLKLHGQFVYRQGG